MIARLLARSLRKRHVGEDEAGAILVVWAVALVALMALTAMAVDLGNISQTKQHGEIAVEDAALSGVQSLASQYAGMATSGAEAQAASVAEDYLLQNYPSLTPGDLATGCSGELPSSIASGPGTNCIGFFNPQDPADTALTPTAMAVALPSRSVAFTFGRAAGLSSQAVSALAYASLKTASVGYGMPFSYLSTGGAGLQCIKTGSGAKAAGCTGFATGAGNFGVINSPRYVIFPGSSTSGGASDTVIETDLILGIDHALNAYVSGQAQVCDAVGTPPNCSAYNNTAPYDNANYVAPQPGQTLNVLGPALFTGGVTAPNSSCVLEARLQHPDGFTGSPSCSADNPTTAAATPYLSSSEGDTFGGTNLNGVQISRYLNTHGKSATSTCTSLLPAGVNATNTAIDAGLTSATGPVWGPYDQCLSAIIAAGVAQPIFSASIEQSPRFGLVPLVGSTGGRGAEEITGFDAAYLDLAFGTSGKVDALLAWVFPPSLIDAKPTAGAGFGQYQGGPFVASLCNFSATGGNC